MRVETRTEARSAMDELNRVVFGQSLRGKLRDVEQLRRAGALGCQGVTKHRIAEGAGCAHNLRPGRGQLLCSRMAYALACLLAEKRQAAACAAAKAAFTAALGIDDLPCQCSYGPRFIVNAAVPAQITGIVKDDLFPVLSW